MRIVPAIALCVVVASPLVAAADPILEHARDLLRSGEADAAVRSLEQAVAVRPDDAVLHYWLARAYGESASGAGLLKMLALARKAGAGFERAVALDPDLLDARIALMEFQLMAPGVLGGGIDAAREQAEEIRKRDRLAGHRAFASIAVARGDLAGARAEHLAALRAAPGSTDAIYAYGVFLMIETGEYASAAEQFSELLRRDPDHLSALFQVGHLAALAGVDLERGAEALRRFLAHPPSDDAPPRHRAHYWLGLVLEKQGEVDDARTHLRSALGLRPGDEDATRALERLSRAPKPGR